MSVQRTIGTRVFRFIFVIYIGTNFIAGIMNEKLVSLPRIYSPYLSKMKKSSFLLILTCHILLLFCVNFMMTVIETESVDNQTEEDIWNLVEAFYHNDKHLMIHSEVCK